EGWKYFKNNLNIPTHWMETENAGNPIDIARIMQILLDKIKSGHDKVEIAAHFHVMLVSIIQLVATENNYKKICFSGGVFQNKLLVDLILQTMGKTHQLYFNQSFSSNDENISFGQLAHHIICHQ
ncbi:MAG: hypothetical protein ABIT06_11710, partial [Saprospiraceae bacterium]